MFIMQYCNQVHGEITLSLMREGGDLVSYHAQCMCQKVKKMGNPIIWEGCYTRLRPH